MSDRIRRAARVAFIALALLVILPASSSNGATHAVLAPHLGYGVNVWDQPDLAAPLGFEWVKLVQEAGPPPTTRLSAHVLYRITIEGDPVKLAQYPEQIRSLVRSARGKVDAYEIGNEPNLRGPGFWGYFDVDIEAYTRLMCAVYPIIKSEDPDAIVVTGGLAPVGRWPGDSKMAVDERFFAMRMFDWMKYLNNGQMCADAFGYHPYGFKYAPELPLDQLDPSDNGNDFAFRGAEKMRDIMEQFGAGGLQMWATEFGWIRDPVSDPWTAGPGLADYSFCNETARYPEMAGFLWMQVSEAQQADYTVRAFRWADDNWPWMGPMFVWNLDFYHRGTSCTPHKFYSLYRATENVIPQRTPAPIYAALRDMPRRSAWTGSVMTVSPDRLSFVGARDNPRTFTATVSIERSGTPFTWTASFDPPAPAGLSVSPLTGAAPGVLTVSADASLFAAGTAILPFTFTYTLRLTADPTTTAGSPFTLPVTVRVLDHLAKTHLPIIQKGAEATPPPSPTPSPTPPPDVITPTTRFGAVFITSAEAPADEPRYQRALATGAGLDRWPLYWPGVEVSEGAFEWNNSSHQVDRAVISDTEHGLQPLIILMNTPDFYATAGNRSLPMPLVGQSLQMFGKVGTLGTSSVSAAGSPPVRLFESVFSDQTDTPGITQTINANNPWARFVYESVNRYKPGGGLAQQLGWPANRGVRHWEIWNEEDYAGFWIGTEEEYARLLKVAYLAAKHADPQAQVIFGGLANVNPHSTWLQDTLDIINTYPDKEANGWFFDAVAEHNYVNAWNTFNYLFRATQALKTYTITNKSLWVTESNVWLCDDGNITPPCLHEDGTPVELRANLDEQAAFVIQSATYATWMNIVAPVEAIFHFQMYDDCADPLPGTTWGGGLGLVRNPDGWGCFPSYLPNTPRPAYAAFQTAIANLREATPKWRARPTPGQELFSFYRPSTQERVMAMWARGYVTETAVLTATAVSALWVWPNGATQIITPSNGVYTLTLPAATMAYTGTADGSALIGGRPYFLVEPDSSGTGGPRP
jgi:hypothetical protein